MGEGAGKQRQQSTQVAVALSVVRAGGPAAKPRKRVVESAPSPLCKEASLAAAASVAAVAQVLYPTSGSQPTNGGDRSQL